MSLIAVGASGPLASAIQLTALVATLWLSAGALANAGLNPRIGFVACVAALAAALVGGRLWMLFGSSPIRGTAFDWIDGERSIIGMAIGGMLAMGLVLRCCHVRLLPHLDAVAPAAFVGYALARIGCLLAGCCFGTPTDLPWGIHYPPGSSPDLAQFAPRMTLPNVAHSHAVHPIPLYHALLGLVLCWATLNARRVPGRSLATGLTGYGIGRFLLEFIRGDARPTELWLSIAQLGSVAFILIGAVVWVASTPAARGRARQEPARAN